MSNRQANVDSKTEIDITPEMLEAGVDSFVAWEESSDPYPTRVVMQIYRSMRVLEPSRETGGKWRQE